MSGNMFKYITDALKLDDLLSKHRASYSAFAGYFCSYFPVELLYGFNMHPVKILGYSQTHAKKRDLINYMCAYLTDVLNGFEEDYYSWADYLIIPATCDSLCGAGEYFDKNITNVETKIFRLPLKLTPDAYQVYKSAVEEVLKWLGDSYLFDNEMLKKAIKMRNQVNSKIRGLMSYKGVPFEGVGYLKLMMAKSVLPGTVLVSFLEDIDKEIIEQNYNKEQINVLVLGPLCDNIDLMDYISRDHNVITKFMTSTLGLYNDEISQDGDVKENLIRYYFSKAGTATSYDYFRKLKTDLDREISARSVKGIIYLNYKFCEPHMFLSKQVKNHLENTDIKFLYLELEHTNGIDALTQTKVDVFMENI
jgi:benzoyl-CoA reductase/2-hydroxyglutaryl-CoA dehydratase subunit BcrC/BadD/HgdB